MGYAPRLLLAGGLGFAVSFLVACGGSSNLLSGDQSSNLNGKLDQLAAAVDAGHCGAAARATASFANSVSNLPGTVSPTLRANLLQGVSTVNKASQRDCRATSTAPTTSSTTTPAPVPTFSTTTTPSTTTTTTPSTTSTTTPSTTTRPATSTTTPGTTSTPTSTTGGAGIGSGTTTTSGPPSGGGATGR